MPAALPEVLTRLEQQYGAQKPEPLRGPFEMILWEIVGYLVPDEQRRKAFSALRSRTRLDPRRILATPLTTLEAITRLGGAIAARERAARLRRSAELVLDEFNGNLDAVLSLPLAQARKALKKFPMIGEPGAEKVLLFCDAHPVPGLESNGLRVLVRLGFGREHRNYAATYHEARDAAADQLPQTPAALKRAHLLLRTHGQDTCLRTRPLCRRCVVSSLCAYWNKQRAE
ncbi:MAG: hypothetical protein HYS05_18150 [Acidobacteria bacterium]|nr:hypothetical protein [Acidobacteriota bacterium]